MSLKLSTVKKLRHSTHIATYLILRKGDQILMGMRQNSGHMDGYWGIPAGHLELGESAKGSLCREAYEEVGIEIAPHNLQFVHATHTAVDLPYLCLYFECEAWSGEIQNREPDKCLGWEFVSLTNLPERTIPYIRDVLLAIEQKTSYTERGWT